MGIPRILNQIRDQLKVAKSDAAYLEKIREERFRALLRHAVENSPFYRELYRGIDIETCQACSNTMKVIACIEDPDVIRKILAHLDRNTPTTTPSPLPEPRAPPQARLFDTP